MDHIKKHKIKFKKQFYHNHEFSEDKFMDLVI